MIINLTRTPFRCFSVMQRLAARGAPVVDMPLGVSEFTESDIALRAKQVIVDPDEMSPVDINDVCNAVLCPVVTLDVCTDVVAETVEFIEYNPDDLC